MKKKSTKKAPASSSLLFKLLIPKKFKLSYHVISRGGII